MQLLDAPEAEKLFPADVRARAKEYLDGLGGGGTGAYTHSQGVEICRQHVAKVCTASGWYPAILACKLLLPV